MNDHVTSVRMVAWLNRYILIQSDNTLWHKWRAGEILISFVNSPSEANIQDPKAHDSTFTNGTQFLLCPNSQEKVQKW